jgi:hypothetical protein
MSMAKGDRAGLWAAVVSVAKIHNFSAFSRQLVWLICHTTSSWQIQPVKMSVRLLQSSCK